MNVVLSLDAPSPRTGTGSALVADGEDVAMVRTTDTPNPPRGHETTKWEGGRGFGADPDPESVRERLGRTKETPCR